MQSTDGSASAVGSDYLLTARTEIAYLDAHGIRFGRLQYEQAGFVPEMGMNVAGGAGMNVAGGAGANAASGTSTTGTNAGAPQLHVLLELADLGSSSLVIDRATSELVEASRYLAGGAKESDCRPERWAGFREDYASPARKKTSRLACSTLASAVDKAQGSCCTRAISRQFLE